MLAGHFLELIRKAATTLPSDVKKAIEGAIEKDTNKTAQSTMGLMLENAEKAKQASTPICQDTGTLIFYIDYGPDYREKEITEAVHKATAEATSLYYLRPNAVDSVTGKNSGTNLGQGAPYIHFHQRDKDGIHARLTLKGGGSENVSDQYKLPNTALNANRDLEGVRRCVIDAVANAQGLGCAPGFVSVGIGGDRGSGFITAKEQLFRDVEDVNPNPQLAEFEDRLMKDLNQLSIGPMGFGGDTTVLSVKVGARYRVPASFFVSVAYVCWAYRKAEFTFENNEVTFKQ